MNKKFQRLVSLDVFRGITITLMIIVNSPGNRTSFSQLSHSIWNGCTLADLVFPFFVFIVGVSSVLTLAKYQAQGISLTVLFVKLVKRTIFLFFMGLLLNAISLHMEWSTLRFLGVLQRIAICYFFTSVLYLTTTLRTQAIIICVLLIGYWLAMAWLPVPGYGYGSHHLTMQVNFAAYADQLLIPSPHLYNKSFDPEGVFSTIPAIATALFGNLLGAWLLTNRGSFEKFSGMILIGILTVLLGWFWGFIFPINKALWTSSYVLWTAGLAILSYACCYWLIEIKHCKKWARPFEIFGLSALTAYILHVFFLKVQAMIVLPIAHDATINLRLFITQALFPTSELQIASLLYAVSYTLLWFVIISIIYRKRVSSKFITSISSKSEVKLAGATITNSTAERLVDENH